MECMRESIKKFMRKKWSGVGAVVCLVLSLFTSLYSEEIKSFFSLQLNINVPIFEIIMAIFATGMIIGSIAFAIEGILSLQKRYASLSNTVEFYNSREELPLLKTKLLQAKQEISFLGVTLEKLIGQETSAIKDTIERGVHMKFLILNSKSTSISKRDKSMTGTKDAITSQLARICKIKSELTTANRNKCEIRTYDLPPLHSIIVLDPKSDDAMILVEFQLYGTDTEFRPSILISKRKQKELFTKYLKSYNYILDQSVEYQCQNS